jgi:hypothetical protein
MALAASPQRSMLHLATDIAEHGASLLLDSRFAGSQKYGFVARSGGGKSYGAGKLTELLLGAGVPVIVLDPVGTWYGLRLGAAGTPKGGIEIAVIGGPHGDVPLPLDNAEALAKLLVEQDGSAVIDLSELRKGERKSFVTPFLEALFHAAKSARRTRMIVIEEAQVFAPQMSKGQERMLGAVEDIVRLGRNYGLGSVLISQRPQSVNKEVLNQVECLFVGQLQGSHERKAVHEWIFSKGAAGGNDVDKQLLGLQPGEFYCWSPQWLRFFGKVRIERKATFDASSTPTHGDEVEAGHAEVRKLDLAWLRQLCEPEGDDVSEQVEAELEAQRADNESVRAELYEQQRSAERAEHAVAVAVEQLAKLRRKVDNARATLASVISDAQSLDRQLLDIVEQALLSDAAEPVTITGTVPLALPPAPALSAVKLRRLDHQQRRAAPDSAGSDLADLILVTLKRTGHGLTRVELAIRVGVVHSGGHYRRVLKALYDEGQLMGAGSAMLTAKGAERAEALLRDGRKALGPAEQRAAWLQRLKVGAPQLDALCRSSSPLSSDALANAIGGKSASGGYFRKGLKALRGAGLVTGDPNGWSLSDEAKHLRAR